MGHLGEREGDGVGQSGHRPQLGVGRRESEGDPLEGCKVGPGTESWRVGPPGGTAGWGYALGGATSGQVLGGARGATLWGSVGRKGPVEPTGGRVQGRGCRAGGAVAL